MKTLIISPLHDPIWENNTICNINRQTVKSDYLLVLNGLAKNMKTNHYNINSENSHADAINTGVKYAKENNYSHVIFFDVDDYYGPNYLSNTLKILNNCDYTGKKNIYTKFTSEEGIYLFDRKNCPLLFSTVACEVNKFIDITNTLQSCSDWMNRMNAKYIVSEPTDYCYVRHGNNAHWKTKDIFIKRGWSSIYYKDAKIEDISNKLINGTITPPITDDQIYEAMSIG